MQATAQAGSGAAPSPSALPALAALASGPSALRSFHASALQPSAAAAAAEPEPVPHASWEEAAELTSDQLTPRQARWVLMDGASTWWRVWSIALAALQLRDYGSMLKFLAFPILLWGQADLEPCPALPPTPPHPSHPPHAQLHPSALTAPPPALPPCPPQVVEMLDRYIVGQGAAKKAVANALRNRWRRHKVPSPLRVRFWRPGPAGCRRVRPRVGSWKPGMRQLSAPCVPAAVLYVHGVTASRMRCCVLLFAPPPHPATHPATLTGGDPPQEPAHDWPHRLRQD